MTDLVHIVAIAESMLATFGDRAPDLMTARAREHEVHGERAGAALWHQVAWAVRELQRLRRRR